MDGFKINEYPYSCMFVEIQIRLLIFIIFQIPIQVPEEAAAFDKSETNAWREDTMVVEAIKPYLENKSTTATSAAGKLRPAFNLAFAQL